MLRGMGVDYAQGYGVGEPRRIMDPEFAVRNAR
jgi:EAL domain-containing protein (putative c-di-GMP-specific phosphodiesterase class I)